MTAAPRKLATIVALDVAGYSARTEADESRTTAEVAALRQVIEDIAKTHGGRVFNTAGDGFMLEFGSSLAAVEAAHDLATKCEPKVRVGVHLGDVVVQPNGDLLGHGVNVAARLMAKSDPGGALISADVRRTIRGPLAERLVSRGLMQLDKMAETIEAFELGVAANRLAVTTKPSEPVLAVLPFDNLSDDREMQFFSDGVSEEILHTVARANGLKVIGRSSSFQFRGPDKAVRKVANELRATHVLDGSVRRAGTRVRVTAHLVEASSQTTLWTDRYDRDVSDVLKLQDELAAAIAEALDKRLAHRPRAHTVDPRALDLYLKARAELASNWLESEKQRAVELLERAVSMAPDFARAWGMLAFARTTLLPMERDTIGEPEHTATLEAARRALTLDPSCAEALMATAYLKPAFSDYAQKARLADRVVEIAPNDAFMIAFRAEVVLSTGQLLECAAEFDRCARLEPSLFIFRAGYAAYLAENDIAEANSILDELSAQHPKAALLWMLRVMFHDGQGRHDEARKLLAPGAPLPDGVTRAVADQWSRFLQLRDLPFDVRESAFEAAQSPALSPVFQILPCLMAAKTGHLDLAFEQLFEALDTGRAIGNRGFGNWGQRRATANAAWFLGYARELRRDRRFPILCARLGLVDYWRSSWRWPDCANEVPYDFKAECEKAATELAKA